MMMAKIKSEEKINVRDVNQSGVSNAAPKITYSITVPADTKAGQTLVAELPDGQRVVVTVPASAKPGRDLFFRVPAGGPDSQLIEVFMKSAPPVCTSNYHSHPRTPTRAPPLTSFVSPAFIRLQPMHGHPAPHTTPSRLLQRPLLNLVSSVGRARDGAFAALLAGAS